MTNLTTTQAKTLKSIAKGMHQGEPSNTRIGRKILNLRALGLVTFVAVTDAPTFSRRGSMVRHAPSLCSVTLTDAGIDAAA